MLLLWPGWVRRKREDDLGRIGPALFDGTNNSDLSINKISSTSYCLTFCAGVQFPFESVRQTRGLLFYALPVVVLTAMVSLPDIYVKTIKPKPEKTCSVDANAPTLGHRTSYKVRTIRKCS